MLLSTRVGVRCGVEGKIRRVVGLKGGKKDDSANANAEM